ncbi:hypothetical protein KAR91_46890 [Candidatus Pacearchaeota archaeon]|nr:hypothetical protein [Candidatus Pacearchaeota archaeon]
MYANKIVRDLKWLLNSWDRLNPDFGTPEYRQQFVDAIRTIQTSHQFYVGSFKEMKPHIKKLFNNKPDELFMGRNCNNLKLPYPSFVVCFDVPFETEQEHKVFKEKYNFPYDHQPGAVIVKQESNSVISIQELIIHFERHRWFLTAGIKYFTFDQDIRETDFYKEHENKPFPQYEWDVGYNWFFGAPVKAEYLQEENGTLKPPIVEMILYGITNLFLILYNQKYIVTETIYKNKPKRKMKRRKNRLLDYSILCVELPKSGKRYRYEFRDNKSKKIMPFSEVPGTWKYYSEEGGGLFGNPKITGPIWVPSYVRGSKKAGFVDKDYCVKM